MGTLLKDTSEQLLIEVDRITFGVRYQPRYEVSDNSGAIVDRILRDRNSPFDPECFPLRVKDLDTYTLYNEETGDNLRINHTDVILQMAVHTQRKNNIRDLSEKFDEFVLTPLREVAHVRDIVRYGVVFQLENLATKLKESPAQHFLSDEFSDVRSLSLRFSRRLPSEEALIKQGVEDFRNVIYTIKQQESGDVGIWLDYQEYFSPELSGEEWKKRTFPRFINKGFLYFEGEFMQWLNNFVAEPEVV